MPTRFTKILHVASALFLFGGCALTHHAPKGWLSDPSALQTESFGGWVQVNYIHYTAGKSNNHTIRGELIALSPDSAYVLQADSLVVVATSDISKASLTEYDAHASELAPWVTLGAVSTLSHGFYLLITAPVLWVIGGGLFASNRSYEPVLTYPKHPLSSFGNYARFPQGLPPHLNRKALKPKPYQPAEPPVHDSLLGQSKH